MSSDCGIETTASGTGLRCAIYTRKSTEEGLNQAFNSLEAQREAAEAYISSQRHAGWSVVSEHYDDGGYTGGNLERPALQKLVADIKARRIDCVVVHKVDRLSRSLLDFARLMEVFERHGVSLVSVTQPLNTTVSLGRLTLNILLSFAQFEREIIAERTRDKIGAAKKKGKWMGGAPALGYDIAPGGGRLVINTQEAQRVRALFAEYLQCESLPKLLATAVARGWSNKVWRRKTGSEARPFTTAVLRRLLSNPLFIGKVRHRGDSYTGEHEAIVGETVWGKAQELLLHERSRRRVETIKVGIKKRKRRSEPASAVTLEPVPRIARLMALALKFEAMLQDGLVPDYASLASLGRVTPPRITQIMNLCNLAPDIQEQILFLNWETAQRRRICERAVRRLSGILLWSEQRTKWLAMLGGG